MLIERRSMLRTLARHANAAPDALSCFVMLRVQPSSERPTLRTIYIP
ncbi:MAG TPA: hypothetical protein VGM39_15880 [Kofleriaceae bacterium]